MSWAARLRMLPSRLDVSKDLYNRRKRFCNENQIQKYKTHRTTINLHSQLHMVLHIEKSKQKTEKEKRTNVK